MATFPIPAGAIDITIPGDFSVLQYVNWNTTYWVTAKTGAFFTVSFATPAPMDNSGVLGYLVAFTPPSPSTGTMTLLDYLTEVRRLLHDAEKDFWSDVDLTADINKAIRQRDLWSGGTRSYRPAIPLVTGQDLYSLLTLFPNDVVLDVMAIWLIYGQQRVRLNNQAFTDVNDQARPWLGYQNRPFTWSRYGQDQVFIAPKPSNTYATDWDLVVLSATLVNPGDTDPLTFPYTEPVPYYAAHHACINARRWDLADHFMGLFIKAMRDIEGARVGELQTYLLNSAGARR